MLYFLQRRWVYHSLIWCTGAVLTSEAVIDIENIVASLWEAAFDTLVYFGPLIICVYLVLFFKSRYLTHQRYVLFSVFLIASVAFGQGLYQLEYYLIGSYSNYFRQDVQNLFFASLMAIGLQHFKRDLVDQYRLKELQARNTEIELAALKTQLNPHFLFNSLNNIYGVVQENAPRGAEMIIGLADIMRYYLRSSSKERISLEEEAQLIQSYIELEALRLNDNCVLDSRIRLNGEIGEVAPLLLLPFIENAFKHGTHPVRACFITINLNVVEGIICFTILNSIVENNKAIKTNIGLVNTMKRLELIYPNRHELEITDTQDTYSVLVKIPLNS
jgi:LytS/YehU family sensor histidine kinase